MAGEPEQFANLHTKIDDKQKLLEGLDDANKDKTDGDVQNSPEYTALFMAEVNGIQDSLKATDIEGEGQYLQRIVSLLEEAIGLQAIADVSTRLKTTLSEIRAKVDATPGAAPSTTPEGTAEATGAGIPKKPPLARTTLTLSSNDTLTGIVESKFGVNWKETPNAAFVLVHALNNLRDNTKKIDPDVLTDGETINVSSILQGWASLEWNEDALAWYQRTSNASQKEAWVSRLRRRSKEKEEKKPEKRAEDYKTGEVVAGDIAKENSYIMQLGAGYDGSTQDHYTLLEGWEWNNATNKADFSVKKVEVIRTASAFEGSVDNTPIGQAYDESDAAEYGIITLKAPLADGTTATRESYNIKNTEYEWVAGSTEIKVERVRNAAEDTRKAVELAAKAKITPQDSEYGTLVVDDALTEAATTEWKWENPFAPKEERNLIRIVLEVKTAYEGAGTVEGIISAETAYTEGKIKLREPTNPDSGFDITEPTRYEWVDRTNQSLGIKELTQEGTFKVDSKDITLNYALLSAEAATALRASTPGFKSSLSQTADFYLLRALNAEDQYGAESRAKYTPFRAEGNTIKFRDYGVDDDVHGITIPIGMTAAQVAEVLNTLTYQAVKTTEKTPEAPEAPEAPEGTVLDFYVSGTRIMLNKTDFTNTALSTIMEGLPPRQKHNLETFAKTILEENNDEDIDDNYVRAPFQIDHDVSGEDAIEIKEGWTDYNDDIITQSELSTMNVNLTLPQMAEVLNILWRKKHS